MFITALFITAQNRKHPSTGERINKSEYIHATDTFNKKERTTDPTTWLSLKDIMLIKRSQTQKS